jgi:hypothetical protein
MLKADGLDQAIIGEANIWRDNAQETVLVYSCDKIADILMTRDSMTEEEAIEFIGFNIEGAYMGKDTPVFVWDSAYKK